MQLGDVIEESHPLTAMKKLCKVQLQTCATGDYCIHTIQLTYLSIDGREVQLQMCAAGDTAYRASNPAHLPSAWDRREVRL